LNIPLKGQPETIANILRVRSDGLPKSPPIDILISRHSRSPESGRERFSLKTRPAYTTVQTMVKWFEANGALRRSGRTANAHIRRSLKKITVGETYFIVEGCIHNLDLSLQADARRIVQHPVLFAEIKEP
jgi:hypothetical protein